MRFRYLSILLATSATLCACGGPVQPEISFIGIASGTLATRGDDLLFSDRFEANQHNLVGIVAFSQVVDGTTVQATWFSPDDRRMPLGRTNIVTESGAQIARFSLASREDWQKSPFMLKIRAWHGEEDAKKTASGSVQFYIDMTDDEVIEYLEGYAEWERQREEERKKQEEEERKHKEEGEEEGVGSGMGLGVEAGN